MREKFDINLLIRVFDAMYLSKTRYQLVQKMQKLDNFMMEDQDYHKFKVQNPFEQQYNTDIVIQLLCKSQFHLAHQLYTQNLTSQDQYAVKIAGAIKQIYDLTRVDTGNVSHDDRNFQQQMGFIRQEMYTLSRDIEKKKQGHYSQNVEMSLQLVQFLSGDQNVIQNFLQ